MRYIYVASSWRNPYYKEVITNLKIEKIEHYDFQHDGAAFDWVDVDSTWDSQAKERNTYSALDMQKLFDHPAAIRGFEADDAALADAWGVLMVLPCGRSAHLELGYAIGKHKKTCILQIGKEEPELMYNMVDSHVDNIDRAINWCRYILSIAD